MHIIHFIYLRPGLVLFGIPFICIKSHLFKFYLNNVQQLYPSVRYIDIIIYHTKLHMWQILYTFLIKKYFIYKFMIIKGKTLTINHQYLFHFQRSACTNVGIVVSSCSVLSDNNCQQGPTRRRRLRQSWGGSRKENPCIAADFVFS